MLATDGTGKQSGRSLHRASISLDLRLRTAGVSNRGTGRSVNQDAYWLDPAQQTFIVADGIGGHPGGDRASQLAVRSLSNHISWVLQSRDRDRDLVALIRHAFVQANAKILAVAEANSGLSGMGTTAVMAVREKNRVHIAGVGDSRAYLFRDGQLTRYTVDDSICQLMVDAGFISSQAARLSPWRNMLALCLGDTKLKTGPEVRQLDLLPGDRLMLLTDGISDCLDDSHLEQLLGDSETPKRAAEDLVGQAVAAGSEDDATCIVAFADHA